MTNIHPTAIVDAHADIADDVEIGPYCTVGPHVKIGSGTRLISHVVVDGHTTMGQRNLVYPFAAIGTLAQHKRSHVEDAKLVIGDDNTFREHVTAHVGSEVDNNITIIGSRNLFLVASHIAHDCVLGDDIVMSNNATLAGHVHVEDRAIIGGLSAVLQFCRIGKGAMIGGMCGIGQDVIPYGIVKGGYEAPLAGINLVGLRRAGVDNKLIFGLQKAYDELFTAGDKNFADRVAALAENEAYKDNPLVQDVIKFVQNPSKYNILQPKAGA